MLKKNTHKLHQLYHRLWQTSLPCFTNNAFVYDSWIDNPNDARRGMTVLTKPDGQVVSNIHEFLEGAQRIDPYQYYYHPAEVHVTILSIISCYSGFRLNHLPLEQYTDIIHASLQNIPSFPLQFSGITASPSCIMIQGFPSTDHLEKIRTALRTGFKQSTLEHSIDTRYEITTAHCTVIRFRRPVTHLQRFLDYLHHYRQYDFGISFVKDVEFVFNDWYLRRDRTTSLFRFRLCHGS